jgi:hypothetical protein
LAISVPCALDQSIRIMKRTIGLSVLIRVAAFALLPLPRPRRLRARTKCWLDRECWETALPHFQVQLLHCAWAHLVRFVPGTPGSLPFMHHRSRTTPDQPLETHKPTATPSAPMLPPGHLGPARVLSRESQSLPVLAGMAEHHQRERWRGYGDIPRSSGMHVPCLESGGEKGDSD